MLQLIGVNENQVSWSQRQSRCDQETGAPRPAREKQMRKGESTKKPQIQTLGGSQKI